MKLFKKSLSVLLCVLFSLTLISCDTSKNVFLDEDYFTKDGELTISPYFAYYNDGKLVKELENIDPEIYKEGALDDGAFSIYFAVCNNTDFDRKINEIRIGFIQTDDGYDIVEPSEFSLDSETYIAAGQTLIIPCVFDAQYVKLEAKLDKIVAQASVVYEGCVLSAKQKNLKNNELNYYIDELVFTSSDGIEGSFTIDNQCDEDKTLKDISFMLYTNKGEKITKQPITMNVDATIEAMSVLTLNYAVLPDNVSDDIKKTKLFDTVEIKILGE